MNENSQTPLCSRCGTPLSGNALKGLCPRCLMALNLVAPTEIPSETGPHGTKVVVPPPALEEIAKHFPQFEILECLGRGGMGVVYKARQPKLNRIVALKILAPEKVADPKFAERFQREAQALARLNHPNIVTVYDFGEVAQASSLFASKPATSRLEADKVSAPLYYLTMEFVDGVSLRQLLQTRKIAPEEALAIVPKICEALQFAHEQGVVHRDIKPENVLLDKQGRLKIADFGIAKIVAGAGEYPFGILPSDGQEALNPELQTLTQGQVLGTPHYMAPEQVEKPATVDHRADIYSLGVVFYEMLTGELPLGRFQAPSRACGKVHVDVRLDEIVLHALEKEPERRYQHASEVKADVETIAGGAAKSQVQNSRGGAAARWEALEPRRKALLWYGFISSVVGLPAGLALHLPVVWGLSLAGIVIAGYKLGLLALAFPSATPNGNAPSRSSARSERSAMGLVGSADRSYFEGEQTAAPPSLDDSANTPAERAVADSLSQSPPRPPRQDTSLLIMGAGFVLPSISFLWFLLFGHRLFGVDLDANVQFWLGVAGLPMSAAVGLTLAWLEYLASCRAGWLSRSDGRSGRWCPQAWVATALLAASLPFAGGAAVMLQLIAREGGGWNPGSGEFWTVVLLGVGTLLAAASSTLLGITATGRIRQAQGRLRGQWPAAAAVAFWPAVLVLVGSMAALSGGADPKPNCVVTGSVLDAETGNPIVGARVDDTHYGPNRAPQQAWTDASGRYELETWYEEHTISASAPGFAPNLQTLLTKPFGKERVVQMDFRLRPAPNAKTKSDDRLRMTNGMEFDASAPSQER